ncbi:cell division protein FtsL [Algihabitans sp.]|uniref:cell division protein FtsL n=1 Tax=Algihabitans sp. TaxID=2821514 RepID=UPI003BAA8771
MILRWTTLLWLVAFAVAVGLVFQIKYAVQALDDQLTYAQTRIQNDREALHILRAEWSYLNRPQRIARLAQRHLEMIPLTAPQIGRIAALPPRPEAMDGRVFAAGPPVPPRHPGAPAHFGSRPVPGDMPAPQSLPNERLADERLAEGRSPESSDPIGDLVAATLQANRAPANASTEAPAIRRVAEPLPNSLGRVDDAVPRNPVTGAPLPVRHHSLSETR